jgi:hypothetical protein
MLRVITRHLGNSYRLDLYGMLGGEWVRLLEEHWRAILAELPTASVTVALSDVEFIDPEGEALLRRMADGVSKDSSAPLTGAGMRSGSLQTEPRPHGQPPALRRPDMSHGLVDRAAGCGVSEEH